MCIQGNLTVLRLIVYQLRKPRFCMLPFLEFGHLLFDLVVQGFLLSHGFSTFWQFYVLEGACHCLLAAQRPIRHRGERRRLRERKNSDGLLGAALNLNCPPHCFIRLTILYTYKYYAFPLNNRLRLAYSQNAFQNLLLRNLQLLRQPHL